MRYSYSLVLSLLAVVASVQAVEVPIQKVIARDSRPVPVLRAIYLTTNNSPNKIVALKVNKDGTLSEGTFTATGGDGGSYIVSDGSNVPTDALASQDCIVREGNFLFVVNAGSNTLSMFQIDSADPTYLSPVGPPVSTIGDFPVSIAVSKSLSLVCVATTGANNGIACYKFSSWRGLEYDGKGLRSFRISQTTPPQMRGDGPSDVFFSEDSQSLYIIVKGNTINDTGFASVFPVRRGHVATKDVRSHPKGTSLLFGAFQIPGTENIFASDASFGGVILHVGHKDVITTSAKTAIPGQIATCWAEYSPVTGSAWVTDPLTNRLVEMDVTTSAIIHEFNVTNNNPGLVDFVVPGNFLYALSPGLGTRANASVIVFDISRGKGKAKQVQNYQIGGNVSSNAQGMTYYA